MVLSNEVVLFKYELKSQYYTCFQCCVHWRHLLTIFQYAFDMLCKRLKDCVTMKLTILWLLVEEMTIK